jgi:hypothetical protein
MCVATFAFGEKIYPLLMTYREVAGLRKGACDPDHLVEAHTGLDQDLVRGVHVLNMVDQTG